jgi:hypothetical protein
MLYKNKIKVIETKKNIKKIEYINIIDVILSFIRSEKQIKVKGIVTGLGVKTPEKINIFLKNIDF